MLPSLYPLNSSSVLLFCQIFVPELFSFLKYLCPLNLHHLLFSNFNHWIALCIISYTYTHPLEIFNLSLCEDFFQYSCVCAFCALSLVSTSFPLCKTDIWPQLFPSYLRTKFCFKPEEGNFNPWPPGFQRDPLPFSITLLHIWRLLSMPSLRSYDKIQKGSGPMPGMVWRNWWLRVLKWNCSRSGQVVWRNRKGDWEGQYPMKK